MIYFLAGALMSVAGGLVLLSVFGIWVQYPRDMRVGPTLVIVLCAAALLTGGVIMMQNSIV